MGTSEHKEQAEAIGPVRCAIYSISDSQSPERDESGKLAMKILAKFGHAVLDHRIVPNDRREIAAAVRGALKDVDLVVTIGGTGISKKDVTVEAVQGLIDKELPGFGELFRAEGRKEIGTAAILSRALLGVTKDGKVVAATPGSPAAVRLALEGILMNELKHLLWELRRHA